MKKIILVVSIFICSCTNISSIKNKHINISYGDDSQSQKIDIFIPEGNGPFPAVFLIHGGGFKAGDKKADYYLAKQLVSRDYSAICVNYRLSGEAKFPAAVHDIKAAIRFVKGNAKKYNINPEKLATWGSSAGGNLSAMIGTSASIDFLEGTIGNYKNESTKIQACVDWFGPIDFTTMTDEARQLGFSESFRVDLESNYIGADATDPVNYALAQKANPTRYIDSMDGPFYIQVGDKDPLIPYLQSIKFADALRSSLGEKNVRFDLIEGGKHGGSKFTNTENINKIIAFLDQNLK